MKNKFSLRANRKQILLGMVLLFAFHVTADAQIAGIGTATEKIRGAFSDVKTLIYAIAAIVGLIGGVRIYNKWTNGDHDINKEIVGWGGAALFITIVPTFIEAILK